MTRPMPGPPGGFTDYARINYALLGKKITYEQYQEFGAALRMAFTARPKRLTDAECAAERGEARADWMHMKFLIASRQVVSMRARPNAPMPEPSPPLERKLDEARGRFYTWRRFATHPHALEEA